MQERQWELQIQDVSIVIRIIPFKFFLSKKKKIFKLFGIEELVAVNTIEWPPKIKSKTHIENLSQSWRMTF